METRLKKVVCILGILLLILVSLPGGAEETSIPHVASTPVRVAIFKNGCGYVERKCFLPAGILTAALDSLPIPVHGTFWVFSETQGVELRNILATTEASLPEKRYANSLVELLEANDGQEVELVILGGGGQTEVVTGRIRVLSEESAAAASDSADTIPAASLSSLPEAAWRAPIQPKPVASSPANLLLLETEQGQLVIDKTTVRQIRGKDLCVQVQKQGNQPLRSYLKLELADNQRGANLNLCYLAKGITWAPSYHLDLLNEDTVRIHAKAQIFNDLEDLNATSCHVIAGYPNLQFSHVTDPMAFRGDMFAWLQNLTAPPGNKPRREAAITQQVMVNVARPHDGYDMRTDFDPSAFAGRGDSDLFYYELGPINLKQGERGYYPLFMADVPYESVYDCRISAAQPTSGDRGEEFAEDVWHALRLHNNTKQPWTTAPATVTKDGLLLGQDTLYFTSLGSHSLLRFTKALDVRVTSIDREISRQRNVPLHNSTWDLVTAEGVINLVNLKPVEVTVIVRRSVEGEIVANPQQAELSLAQSRITGINPTATLSWELKVKPRETAQLKYTYKQYVQ